MKFRHFLSVRNLLRRPVRTAALVLLSVFMSFSVFAGSVITASLRNGLESYSARLGADVVVVPYAATTKGTLESVLLQGIPGNFYMEAPLYEKIRRIEGVEVAAPQFYLASATASCCSVAVQLIGFDPDLDFSIQPWIRRSYEKELAEGDIIIGNRISMPTDRILSFYGVDCRVVAQLDETGTGLDTAIYANMDTIAAMIRGAQERNFHYFDDIDPVNAVSCVMIKVKDGYDPELVAGNINIHVRKVSASKAGSMISGIAGGLKNVSAVIGLLTAVIWILAVVILAVAFAMISHERRREFAILRTIGATAGMVSGVILGEAAIQSLIGAVCGIALACLAIFPFHTAISSALGLPYLMPRISAVLLYAGLAILFTVAAAAGISAFSAHRVSRQAAGTLLREDN